MATDAKNQEVIKALSNYRKESEQAKHIRMAKNKMNFEAYHLRQDYSHKKEGQSAEFLPKQSMAVEQISNFIQQGLVDIGDWFRVDPEEGVSDDMLKIKSGEIQRILNRQLESINFLKLVGDSVKLGLLGSLMIAKVTGKMVPAPRFETKESLKDNTYSTKLIRVEDQMWQLQIDLVRQEDFFPDPTGRGLYEMQDIYMDFHEIEKLSKGKDAIYDPAQVKLLKSRQGNQSLDDKFEKSRETGQNSTNSGYRNQVKVTEIWGTILGDRGEILHENIVTTIADDAWVIQKPTPNPFWHKESPFVVAPIMSVPHSVWGKALMDAPTMLNKAINELFNLTLDGGLMSVHGIKQIRESWLDDPAQVENGIFPGDTLRMNNTAPPGAKVLERVDTATVPADGLNVLNVISQEFNASALTNDLRQGVQSFRQVKATEVIEASQSITSMFTGMAKQIESSYLSKLLEKSWKVIAQHITDLNTEKTKALIGRQRGEAIQALSNEELFAETVSACLFRVFGVSATLNKQRDFTKIQALLQTVASSEILLEEYAKKYDFGKLLTEVMKSLDIDTYKLQADERGPDTSAVENLQETGNEQSQIPQAGAAGNQGDLTSEGQIPQAEFPASSATGAAGVQGT